MNPEYQSQFVNPRVPSTATSNVLGLRGLGHNQPAVQNDVGPVRRDPQAAAAALAVFDALEQAVIVIDQSTGVRYQNSAALDTIARQAGLDMRAGRLVCTELEDQDAFSDMICGLPWHNPTTTQPQVLRLSRKNAGGGLLLSIRLLTVPHPDGYGPTQLALITVVDREMRVRGPSTLQLKQAFSLTRAEAAVAVHIANGDTPAEIARYRTVSVETIRAQLRVLYSKTGTNRQAELVRLMQQLAALG